MHHHHPTFAALSILVAVLGSWTALDLFRRVRSHIGRARAFWLGTAAVAMGLSIWSMHFVAMLGFDPGMPVSYDPFLTALSLGLAMAATWGAFFFALESGSRLRTLAGGAAMGAGICLMHYVGMAAVRMAAQLSYALPLVTASLAIAVGAATAALFAAHHERTLRWRAVAAVVLGLAICGMHYTGMAALRLTPIAGVALAPAGAPPFALGASVAAGASVILVLALLASLYDQRLNVMAALDAGGVGYWELAVPEMQFHISPRAKEIFGRDPRAELTHGQAVGALSPDDRRRRDDVFQAAVEGRQDYDAEYRLAGDPSRWINIRGRVVSWRAGRPRRLSGVMLDVSDRRQAFDALEESQRRQRLLIDELNHRVKNTLATVQSIARHSAKGAASIAEFQDAFEDRLMALSKTHDALTRGGWSGASLRELLAQELAPYAPHRIVLDGPDVSLNPRGAVALGMVFHELATNAAKYGALSSAEGGVQVSWRRRDGELELRWREAGGPAVAPPSRRGFGTQLVEGTLVRELGGHVDLAYEPAGFEALMRVPVGVADEDDQRAA